MSEQTVSFSENGAADQIESELLTSHSSMLDKMAERQRLDAEIEAFISGGGSISRIDKNVMTDPPRRPENKYGSHPI
ncbi:MAG: hypothetical protein ACI9D5_000752 [Candidatus Endobugula sp.]|jgi:hypothetical protein